MEEPRTPVGRSDFKFDEGRLTSLVGSTPTLFRPTSRNVHSALRLPWCPEPRVQRLA